MTNGKVRKSLADQLDRLDGILDVLGDGLNEAIADAVKSAVTTAVQSVLSELLTNTEVLSKLGAVMTKQLGKATGLPAVPKKPGLLQRVGELMKRLRNALASVREAGSAGLQNMRTWFGRGWQWMARRFAAIGNGLSMLKRLKWQVLTATGIGLGIGMAAWFAGPWFSSVLSGIGGFTTTIAGQPRRIAGRVVGTTSCP
jgi:hypothetical protein